jgi:polyhydroxyalkanoate synthesis regulator phasin
MKARTISPTAQRAVSAPEQFPANKSSKLKALKLKEELKEQQKKSKRSWKDKAGIDEPARIQFLKDTYETCRRKAEEVLYYIISYLRSNERSLNNQNNQNKQIRFCRPKN